MMMNTMSGRTPVERLDDAVRRILRVKFELGLFDNPFPNMGLTAEEMAAFGPLTVNSRTNNPAYRAALNAAVAGSNTILRASGEDLTITYESGHTSTTELAETLFANL
jgi:beta-glucosidase-like glycosyl hydrolase